MRSSPFDPHVRRPFLYKLCTPYAEIQTTEVLFFNEVTDCSQSYISNIIRVQEIKTQASLSTKLEFFCVGF
jgi:hypothetical protein